MRDKFLQGKRTWTLGRIRIEESGTSNYVFGFRRQGRQIAQLYYHHHAKQIVMRVSDDVDLTMGTIAEMMPFMPMSKFRQMRRYGQSLIRNRKDTPHA